MNQQRQTFNNFRSNGDFGMRPTFQGTVNAPANQERMAPPLPPRINRSVNGFQPSYGDPRSLASNYYGGYGGINSYGSPRGYNAYGGYGGYSGYGIPSSYNTYDSYSGNAENRFLQLAEESTRPAFQSIETMVQTFSSLTMMLESTFFAMTSSFRAILSIADNFGRLRSMLGQVLNTFSLFKLAKWLYRKSMYMLGLQPDDPNSEIYWNRAASEVINGQRTGPTSWPILMFFGLLFAIPYCIHKLVTNTSTTVINVSNPKEWFSHQEPIYTATAAYDFNATSHEELSLKVGQKVWLAPKPLQPKDMPGWWRATDTVHVGLIPSSYVTVVGQLKKKSESTEQLPPSVEEISDSTSKSANKDNECDLPNFSKEYENRDKSSQ